MIKGMNTLKRVIKNSKNITCHLNTEIEKRDLKFSIDKF